jgi:hypothetical protein
MLLKVWAQQHALTAQGVLPAAAYACYGQQQQQQQQQQGGNMLATAAVQADGFSGHLLAALLLAAVQKVGDAAAVMSPLQLMRSALQLLADKKQWGGKGGGLSLARDASVPAALRQQQSPSAATAAAGAVEGKVSKDHARLVQKLQQQQLLLPAPSDAAALYSKAYDVTLLDSSGLLNLAAAVSSTQLQLAQAAAQQSLAVLDTPGLEPDAVYAAVFKPGQGLTRVFHYCWTVKLPHDPSATSSSSSSGGGSSGGGGILRGWQQEQQHQQQQLPGDVHPMR